MFCRIVIYCFLAFLFGCKKENATDCFKSNGPVTSEIRSPGSFTEIELNDKIDVEISKGAECKIEVIAGRHILKNIVTTVSDGVLKIENKNKCNFVRGYKKQVRVNITLPYVGSVLNNSVAEILINEGFEQDSVKVRAESSGDIHLSGVYNSIRSHSNGNGDIYLNGSCNSLFVYINGTNYLKAEELSVRDYLFIETLTEGDCYVNATGLKKFEYILYSEGNIYYKGEPASISGVCDKESKGKVIKEN